MKKFAFVNDGNVKILQDVTKTADGSNSETEFQWALRVRNIKKLHSLLDEKNCNYFTTKDNLNRNPFHIACLKGYNDVAVIILNNLGKIAIDINSTDDNQLTGMMLIAS